MQFRPIDEISLSHIVGTVPYFAIALTSLWYIYPLRYLTRNHTRFLVYVLSTRHIPRTAVLQEISAKSIIIQS